MRSYIWDKTSNVAGVPASYLLELKPEFREEPVIGIVDKFGIIIHFETMSSLKEKYNVSSNIPDVVAEEVIHKLNNNFDMQPNGLTDGIDEGSRIYLEAIMYDVRFSDNTVNYTGYIEPDCRITTTKNDDNVDRSITVVIENLTILSPSLEEIYKLKIMKKVTEKMVELKEKLQEATDKEDEEAIEKYSEELDELENGMLSTEVMLNIGATDVYEYDEFILIKTTDGQCVIIDKEVVDSSKHNSLAYEKTKEDGSKGRVHYETIYVRLSKEIETELREFDETVYITY